MNTIDGRDENMRKQWHSMMIKSIKVALRDAAPEQIEVSSAVPLFFQDLPIETYIIHLPDKIPINHPIAQLFKLYNVIGYQSSQDCFSLDDFDTILAYTRYHHILQEYDEDLLSEYTITCLSRKYPKDMLYSIQKRGIRVEEHRPIHGIYQIFGEMIPVQLVVLDKLDNPELDWPFVL